MNIQGKLSIFIVSVLLIMVTVSIVIGTWVINKIVYSLNAELLSLKLEERFQRIEASVKLLEGSGVAGIESYVTQTQNEVFQEFRASSATSQKEQFYVVDGERVVLFHTRIHTGTKIDEPFMTEMLEKKGGTIRYVYEGIPYFAVYRHIEAWNWIVGFSLSETEMFRQRALYLRTVGMASAIALALLIGIAYCISKRMVVTPLSALARVSHSIAAGDFRQDIRIAQQDEIGNLAAAILSMKNTIERVVKEMDGLLLAIQQGMLSQRGSAAEFSGKWGELIGGVNNVIEAFAAPFTETAHAIERLSEGDISHTLPEDYSGDFNMLVKKLNVMISALQQIVVKVQTAAETVATSSEQMSSSMQSLSEGVSQQAAVAEEVSSSMEEMTANIRQSTDNALQTERIAVQSAAEALEASHAVVESVNAMREIAKKIAIIEEIARETHMLSLNATIEAAKAQDYGKGFGVVAAEVRSLAERSRIAAEEINELANRTMVISERAGVMLESVVPNIQKTANLVKEISAASHEQNSGVGQINSSIQQLDRVLQHNVAIFEELANTSEILADQAGQLRNTVEFFKLRPSKEQTETAISEATEPRQHEPAKPPEKSQAKEKRPRKNRRRRFFKKPAVERQANPERMLSDKSVSAPVERRAHQLSRRIESKKPLNAMNMTMTLNGCKPLLRRTPPLPSPQIRGGRQQKK